MSTMHPDARRATAWLIGYSSARLEKPDDAMTRYPGDNDAGLRNEYGRGRQAGIRSLATTLVLSA